jgi:chemotaxis signal transduction protein
MLSKAMAQQQGATVMMPMALGEHRLAVDALAVLEILGVQQWVAIPNTPPLLPGALAWRGRAIGVFDLGPALELPALRVPNTRSRNVIISVGEDTVALSVDRALEVCRIPNADIRPVHVTSWVADSGLPCRNEFEFEGHMIPVLDLQSWVRRKA